MAKKISGRRYPANMGLLVDCESDDLVVQVKERRTLSLAALEALVLVIRGEGVKRSPAKTGIVVVKRSARKPTPFLAVLALDDLVVLLRRLALNHTVFPGNQ